MIKFSLYILRTMSIMEPLGADPKDLQDSSNKESIVQQREGHTLSEVQNNHRSQTHVPLYFNYQTFQSKGDL